MEEAKCGGVKHNLATIPKTVMGLIIFLIIYFLASKQVLATEQYTIYYQNDKDLLGVQEFENGQDLKKIEDFEVSTPKGNVFAGWAVNNLRAQIKKIDYYNGQEKVNFEQNSNDVYLYAVWAPKEYKLTIDPDGGEMLLPKELDEKTQKTNSIYDKLSFSYGEERLFMKTTFISTTTDESKAWLGTYKGQAVNDDNLPIKDGYIFKEWQVISGEGKILDNTINDEDKGIIHNYYFDGNCDGDVIIQAKWEKLPTITVDPNGATMKLAGGEKVTAPHSITFYPENEELRIFAKVGKISGAEISQEKWFGFTRVNGLNVPYKMDYDFVGWKIIEGEGKIVEEKDTEGRCIYLYDCSYKGNVTIQAQWKAKKDENIKVSVKKDAKTIIDVIKIEDKRYIVVEAKSSVQDILNDFETNLENNNLIIKNVRTNEEVLIDGSNEKTDIVIVVKGDLNSDGKVNFRDIIKLNNSRLNKKINDINWNVAEKIAYKTVIEKKVTDVIINLIAFKNILTVNNYRLKIK